MAKRGGSKQPSTPDDFPQVEPTELFPTNNIRFVISETAKLIERVDALARANEKLGDKFDRSLDKHSEDIKDRIAELKSELKDNNIKLVDVKSSIDSFKGAMKVLGGIYALALVLLGAFLAWYLRPNQQVLPTVTQQQSSGPAAIQDTNKMPK